MIAHDGLTIKPTVRLHLNRHALHLYGVNHVVCALADLWESPYSFLLAVDLVYSRSTSGDDASARLSRFSKKGSGFLCATATQKDWGLRVNELSSDGVMIASIIVWYARICFCGTPQAKCRCCEWNWSNTNTDQEDDLAGDSALFATGHTVFNQSISSTHSQ